MKPSEASQSQEASVKNEVTITNGSQRSKTSTKRLSSYSSKAKRKSTSKSLKTPAETTKGKQNGSSKLKVIDIEVDKVHALIIKEYDGMVIDIFTTKPIQEFMKPLEGYRVIQATLILEKLEEHGQ